MRPRHGPRRRGDPSGGFRASPRGGRPSRAPPPRKSGYSLRILLGRGLASRSSRPAPSSPLPKGPVLAAPVSLSRCPPCPPPPLPHPAARAASAPGRACLGRVALAPELVFALSELTRLILHTQPTLGTPVGGIIHLALGEQW